ncbi:MAG TPA: hypothetical protein ENK18_25005 [Deltaproteobacteria bacterium]|nr:hypothetical protein [Deltaproteobacteria bacterium]
MSEIQDALHELASARLTPAMLNALDFIVPGEWDDVHSLEEVIESSLEIDDPAEVARIKARAEELYAQHKHYSRALMAFRAADKVDKAAAAAVMASKAGSAISFLGLLERFTPKPDTTQALDAALKLAAEVLAFAQLRGIPVSSLTEAKAFPATLATYARADLMRLAAWMMIDGILPLGPEFVSKIKEIVSGVDTSSLTNNALFQQLRELMPGSSDDDRKGFILSTLDSGEAFLAEFVKARGIEPEDILDALGSAMEIANSSAELLAATLDATTDYYAHTGVQSVARVLVHDAAASLEGEPMPTVVGETEGDGGLSPWFKGAAVAAGAGAAGVAIGGMMLRRRGDGAGIEEGGGAWLDDDEVDADGDGLPDLSDDAFAARELAAEMLDREVEDLEDPDLDEGDLSSEQIERRDRLRARRRRRIQRAQQMRRQRGGPGMRARAGRRRRRRGPGRRAGRVAALRQENMRLKRQIAGGRRRRRGRRRGRG